MTFRLAFSSARAAFVDGDDVYCDAGLGRLVDALVQRSPDIRIALGVVNAKRHLLDHRISIPARRIFRLPGTPRTTVHGFFLGRPMQSVMRAVEEGVDASIVQLPFTTPFALWPPKLPRVYHVCSNLVEAALTSRAYRGASKVAAVGVAAMVDGLHRALLAAPHVSAVTNGQELWDRYHPSAGRAVVSSTLRQQDLQSVVRKRVSGRFRVLFVGYLRPEKGLDVLSNAFRILLQAGVDAELDIIGAKPLVDWGLQTLFEDPFLKDRVHLRGEVGFGPELFQAYADADVLVLPSRTEGTPRVLVEARAFGCPVIASRVGGIPSSVQDEEDGLLVSPGDADALAVALRRIHDDVALRSRLRTCGQERVRAWTVDALAAALVDEAQDLCERVQHERH